MTADQIDHEVAPEEQVENDSDEYIFRYHFDTCPDIEALENVV